MTEPQWLTWARQIQAIAQTGDHYTENGYDRERYHQLADLAAEIIAHYTPEIDKPAIHAIFADQQGYLTPKIDVRGVVFNAAGDILLVREKADNDRWTLPGGWADVNTPPSTNVEREVLEEAGYQVKAAKLLALYDRQRHPHPPMLFHTYKAFFRCDLLSETPVGSPQGDLEISAVAWFAEDALPAEPDISIGRVTVGQLHNFFDHYRNPDRPTEFD